MPICIAGMHRSNTSMVSQLLSLSGVYVGPQHKLMEATQDNPEGYWEDERFVELNDRILDRLGGSWDQPPKMAPGYSESPGFADLRDDAAELAASNSEHQPWGWKDPRNCLTYEFWDRVVPDLKCVICVRDPIEVAQSMANRQYMHLIHLDFQKSVGLWETYYGCLAKVIDPSRAIVTHSASYFYDADGELKRVLAFLGIKPSSDQRAAALGAVKHGLRRSVVADYDALEKSLPSNVRGLYARLCGEAGPVFEKLRADEGFQLEAKYTTLEEAVARIKHLERYFSESADTIEEIHRLKEELRVLKQELENMNNTRWWKARTKFFAALDTLHLRRQG